MSTKPAMCDVCGAAHWLRDPHVFSFGETVETTVNIAGGHQPYPVQLSRDKVCDGCLSRDKRIAELEAQLGSKREKDAERQRKRRAK
jgi:hypothetical protein